MRILVIKALKLIILVLIIYIIFQKYTHFREWTGPVGSFTTDSVELHPGDILVRPNWGWLPGSCNIPEGRKYGHVALITQGAKGTSIEEALQKAMVVEALFFDQKTRKFQFRKEDQIREAPAITSFGEKFKGIRYLLRTNLESTQTDQLKTFVYSQLEGGYNILSTKRKIDTKNPGELKNMELLAHDWHCATLIWEAFYTCAHTDLDANGGWAVYPSDLIACPLFDKPGARIRF